MIEKYPIIGRLHGTINRTFEPAGAPTLEPALEAPCAHAFGPQLLAQSCVSGLVEILKEGAKERLQAIDTVYEDNTLGNIIRKLGESLGYERRLADSRRTANQHAFSFPHGLMQEEAFSFAVDNQSAPRTRNRESA